MLQPLGDRVLIEPLVQEETTKSGIVLPETVEKNKKEEGKVLAIGDGEKVKALNLSVGDVVLFGKYSGDDVEFEDKELKFLKHEDVLAVVKK
ncbi:MAG: co-chaperone GroES [Patescibacteria group bacterium]